VARLPVTRFGRGSEAPAETGLKTLTPRGRAAAVQYRGSRRS